MNLAKLRGVLAERRITQKALGEQLKLTTKTINLKLNGKVDITVDQASLIGKFLKLTNEEKLDIFFN